MTCPICNKEAAAQYRPFCSRRCADIDLGRWLTGGYAIPVARDKDDPDASPSDAAEAPTGFRPQ